MSRLRSPQSDTITFVQNSFQLRDKLLGEAVRAQQTNQPELAERLAREVLALDADSIPAKFLVGIACARKGAKEEAVELLSDVLAREPRSLETLVSLAELYRDLGRFDEAVELAQRATALQPREPQVYNLLGRTLMSCRRLSDACSSFEKALQLNPRFAPAYFNLGKAKQMDGKDGEAARAFAQAAKLAPTLENLLAYGQSLLALADWNGALACSQTCAEKYPNSAAARLLLCGALTELNRYEEAKEQLETAISLDEDGREALQIAHRQRPLGLIDEANGNLRRAIAQNPRLIQAYDSLILNQKTTEADRHLVEQMEALVSEARLAITEAISLHYALGKAHEELGDFERSMGHYDEANRLTRDVKFGESRFDPERYRAHVDDLIQKFLQGRAGSGSTDATPILIVGMMRSGTTLAEQILSSHPDVGAAGEQLFWSQNWRRTDSDLQLGQEYVQTLRAIQPDTPHITDKMPGNCMFAGLIHAALPEARILHIRRNPLDNCLSIWATPNQMPHEGGHVKSEIAFVYRQYLRLMERTREVLPPDRFLEIDYEDLVSNQEAVTRKMLEFCGLNWDERCLRPQDNQRTVLTPSAWQVRQPVYRSSVARWKKFEPWLGDFCELIGVEHPPLPK